MEHCIRGPLLAAVSMFALLGAPQANPAQASGGALQRVEVSFTAHDFGRGPGTAKPIHAVEGRFALAYDAGDPAKARLESFELRQTHRAGRGWIDTFTLDNVQVQVTPDSILLGARAPLASVSGGTDDFVLRLQFDAANPDIGKVVLAGFGYSVQRDGEVYETRQGSVSLRRLAPQN